jgi:hypothetical protein
MNNHAYSLEMLPEDLPFTNSSETFSKPVFLPAGEFYIYNSRDASLTLEPTCRRHEIPAHTPSTLIP